MSHPTQSINCASRRNMLVALLATLLCHAAAETVAVNAAGATTPASGQGARIAADEMRGRCVDALPNCGELAGSNLSACGEFPELLLSECAATCSSISPSSYCTLKVPSAWLTAQMRPRHQVPQLCQLARTRSPWR